MATYFDVEARGPARAKFKREEGKGGEKEGDGDGGGGSGSCGGGDDDDDHHHRDRIRHAYGKHQVDRRLSNIDGTSGRAPSCDVSACATLAKLHDAPGSKYRCLIGTIDQDGVFSHARCAFPNCKLKMAWSSVRKLRQIT